MKILLVYPETPQTFWSFHNALKFVSKKSAEPPLGLITVAAMLPDDWDIKLIDTNVKKLKDPDILWADYVFISGMNVHQSSMKKIIRRCNLAGIKVVAGGPLVTTAHEEFLGVDHFILNEAEITLPPFLSDLEKGTPKKIYSTEEYPDISTTPVPRWDLLDMKKYATMEIQYSRGCPFDCEFCSVTMLNGRKPRYKEPEQFLRELNVLYDLGWRNGVFIVDDNFIGNKQHLKTKLLPELIKFSQEKNYPFNFSTEVSINLADDPELMTQMKQSGFVGMFVGIETPNSESLEECGKKQNLKRNLVDSVKVLQNNGFIISAGFIIGFDNDNEDIFERQISFIQRSGIAAAMVGLLNAPRGTKLFKRLDGENRMLNNFTGNNTDGSLNFIPKMNYNDLIKGYARVIKTIYTQREYYHRLKTFLENYNTSAVHAQKFSLTEIKALGHLFWKLGLREKGKIYFWKLFLISLFKYPQKFSIAMTLAVYGFHFRKVAEAI